MIIAIDGTASSGKTTASKELSARLNIPLVPTGSIYRAITLKALYENIKPEEEEKLEKMLSRTTIDLVYSGGRVSIYLDRIPEEYSKLESEAVSNNVTHFACKPFIRDYVRKIQRAQAEIFKDIIVEGRDIGSVVFPDATIKFFVDADIQTRAKRRFLGYVERGEKTTLEEVKQALIVRDKEDETREISPLIMTADAIIIDTSDMSIQEVVDKMVEKINEKKSYLNIK